MDLRFCERHKAPVLCPRLIVNFTEPSAFIPKIFEIRWTKSDGAMPVNATSETPQLRHRFLRIGKPPRVQIFRFCKPAALDQLLEIRRIELGHDVGRKLE